MPTQYWAYEELMWMHMNEDLGGFFLEFIVFNISLKMIITH